MRIKVSLVAMAVLALVSIGSAQQGQGGGRRQGGRGMQMGAQRLTQLLRNTQVQDELKLTDDEKAKIEALPRGGGPGGGGQGGGQGGGGGQRRGGMGAPMTPDAMTKQYTEDKATTSAILTPEQEKRLEELRIQWAGPMAVLYPDVQDAIGLSADQKSKITTLQTNMTTANQKLMADAQDQDARQAAMQTVMANMTTMRTELDKVLTDDQKAKLKTMGGTELKMEMRRPGGGGGAPPRA